MRRKNIVMTKKQVGRHARWLGRDATHDRESRICSLPEVNDLHFGILGSSADSFSYLFKFANLVTIGFTSFQYRGALLAQAARQAPNAATAK